jgi:hypothetical protein
LQYYGKSPHNIDILSIDFTASDGSLLFNHFPEDGENVAQIKIRFTNSFFANEYYKSLGSLINLNELQPPQQTPGASTYEIYIPIDKFEKMVNSKNYGYDAFEKSENTQKKEKPTETKLLQQHPAATPGTPHANRESQEHNKTTEDKMPKPSQEETRMPIAKSS